MLEYNIKELPQEYLSQIMKDRSFIKIKVTDQEVGDVYIIEIECIRGIADYSVSVQLNNARSYQVNSLRMYYTKLHELINEAASKELFLKDGRPNSDYFG